jgi:hypothetical protein
MNALETFLAAHKDINFIRLGWLDLFGILRSHLLTKRHALHLETTARNLTLQPAAL